jgi:hypothetical protein
MVDRAKYIKEWRKTPAGKEALRRQVVRERARAAAVQLLIERHKNEWQALYADMLRAYGVE